jgi:Transposase domain (DUF772)
MLIVGYCYGIRSERRLCEEVELHLAYRWFCRLDLDAKVPVRIPTIATSHSDSSRPPIPIDRDRCGAGFLKAPLDNALHQCLARWANWSSTGEAVPVVNRRDLRATRRALVADAAARAGGAC